MPEPIVPTELLQPQRLTIGETPVYLTSPLDVNGQPVTQLTIQGERTRGKNGIDSSVLLIKEKSRRRGEEGVAFSKPLVNVNAMEEVDWDKVEGIQFTGPDGAVHTIPKEQLSLTKPKETPRPLETLATPAPPPEAPILPDQPTTREPKLARSILEKYSGEPTTLTIVGLKAYETRAHDLAAKSMQVKPEAAKDILHALDNIGENIWKHGIGPVYFQEKARQYYMDMLKASHSPFADRSIKIAEAAGKNRYQELLDNKNFLTRGSRRFIEWVKSSLGARTLAQQFALEEIAHMRETGEIKESEAFEREGASIRKRFEMDFNSQDDVIRKTLGEKLDILDPANAEHKPLAGDIRGLVRRYATGEIATKADFDKASDELFQTHLKGGRLDIFHEAELYSSSLYEVAETMRTKASHEGGLASIDAQLEAMQVRLGMGVMGEATALEPTDVQRGTEMVRSTITWLEKKGIIGPFMFNEVTVSSGVAVALSLVILPKTAISSMSRIPGGFIGFAGGAAVGAVFGGVREYRMLEREYLTHLREREAGLTFSPDAKRRAWMERFFVGQRSADDLITAINSDDIQTKLANLADAKARKALSARQHERNAQRVGLIQFSGRENIETQRTALDLTIAQAEKDLSTYLTNHPDHPDLPTLADLTAAQTRILSEGVSRVEGLSDPMRVTLNLLDKYNPEVEIIRRRFPLLGPEAKTGAKAQGLEDILKEFRRAARGEAVKKGLQVGLSGAIIGLGIREGLHLGSEVLSNITQHTPDISTAVDVSGQHIAFSNNLHMQGADLVDKNNAIIVPGLQGYLGNDLNHAIDHGELTQSAKDFITKEAIKNGYQLDIPAAVKTSITFSNDHLSTHLGSFPNGESISAPPELHWMNTDTGRQLVLDGSVNGTPGIQILYTDTNTGTGMTDTALLALKHNGLFNVIDAKHLSTIIAPDHGSLAGIPQLVDAQGGTHAIEATFPKGTELIAIGHAGNDHIYQLVDSNKNVLLHNVHINDVGKITNLDKLNPKELLDHNLSLTNPHGDTFSMVEKGGMGDVFNKPVAEMGAEHGASGPWGWLEDPINADKTIAHALPGTNLTKNLFRGFQENYLPTPEHANYTTLNPGDVYHGLPKALFEDSQLVKLGHIMDEAIKMKEVDGTKLADMDELHRAAYEIGRIGRVATKDEIQTFLDAMGGGEKSVTLFTPIITRTLLTEIPASITGNGSVVTNIITLAERAAGNEFNWIPPIPIVWRMPLEAPMLHITPGITPPEFTPPTYFTYGGEQVFLTGDEYQNRRSPKLTQDSETKLNQQEEISWYLSMLSEEDRQDLDVLMAQYNAPVPDTVKSVIAIPANREGLNIYTSLSQYAKQKDLRGNTLDPQSYEVVVYDNHTTDAVLDNTKDEVLRFKHDHPEMNVVYLNHALSEKPTIGRVRRNLTNSILKRLESRSPALPDVAIVSNDADSIDLPDTYLATIMATFDTNKRLDAVTGRYDFPEEVYKKYPVLFATERAWQLMDAIVRHNEQAGIPQLMGANSAVRAGTFAAIGGYNPKSTLGEDLEVGWMIQSARKSDPTRFLFSNTLKLSTDPRRAIYKYLQGAGLLDRYTDFANNTEIRGLSWQELATRAQETYSREKLEDNITRLRNELYPWLKNSNPEALDRYFKRSMDFLGVTYEIHNDKVIITDDSVLRAGINADLTPEQVVSQISATPAAQPAELPQEIPAEPISPTVEAPIKPPVPIVAPTPPPPSTQ